MLFLFQNIRPYFFSWFAKVTYEKSSTRGIQTRKILQKIFAMIIYSFFWRKKNANKIHIHTATMKIFEKILQVE